LKTIHSFSPSDFFVLRTPLLPFAEFLEWGEGLEACAALDDPARFERAYRDDVAHLRRRLNATVTRSEIRDALFVASPNIIERFHLWTDDPESERGRKVEHVLVRYFSRLTGRATPFGLFAGVSVGTIGDQTRLSIAGRHRYRRHTRLDMDYLFALTNAITREPALRNSLIFHVNNSLHRISGIVRYVESRLEDKVRSYHLVAVEDADYLTATLKRAASGATPDALAVALVDEEVTLDEAREYIARLIDSQILTPDIALVVSGPEPVHPLIEQLRAHSETQAIAGALECSRTELELMDRDGLGVEVERYRAVAQSLKHLPAKVELSRLFQVDLHKPAPEATLGGQVLAEIARGVELLHSLSSRTRHDELARFREAFSARYEEQEVPLVEALDEEIGVGFETSEETTPLLKHVQFPSAPEDGRIDNVRHAFLLRKLCEALTSGAYEISFEPDELEPLKTKDPLPLPDGFSIEATVAAPSSGALSQGGFRVLIRGGSGPSGAALFGRFCHADERLRQHVTQHLRNEEALQPEAIFAEIVYLPEGRIGNVISRPRMRDYEIPYLARSVVPDHLQLPVQDLRVSVRGGRVRLSSARLDQEVIPRLTNAHNYSWLGLGIYRFLCLLQHQGTTGLGWDWGALADAPFLPRVCSGRLVLSLARWRVIKNELRALGKQHGAARFRAVQSWRAERRLPRLLALSDGDNTLPVDLDNALSVESFVQLVKDREAATLVELFPGPDELCAHGPEGAFVHELIVPFGKSKEERKDEGGGMKDEEEQRSEVRGQRSEGKQRSEVRGQRSEEQDQSHVSSSSFIPHPSSFLRSFPRRFPPGSEWLYAKLYTGTATADRVLCDVVSPLVEQMIDAGVVDQWFFVRYGDPEWHLRLRFHGAAEKLHAEAMPALQSAVNPLLDEGLLWRVQFDTYEREVERYGGAEGMVLAERLFHADSDPALEIVEMLEPGDAGADERWRLAVCGIDRLLADFGFELKAKCAILKQTRESFAKEFNADKNLRAQLSEKFRKERQSLETLPGLAPDSEHPLAPGLEVFRRRSEKLAPIVAELKVCERAGRLSVPLSDLMVSYIHMHANRLLRSAQRQQELVIYDLLTRLYESQAARAE
jgi:thiopeptide-type bacteriocin biosynthesis protein